MTDDKKTDLDASEKKPALLYTGPDDVDEDLPFLPDPAFLRKRMAIEAMHEAGQFVDPDDFDVD